MKKRIAEQWIAALCSGEYKQTTGFLRNKNRFCCLGVLCNLHAQAHPEIAKKELSKNVYLNYSTILPVEVQKWAGLNSRNGSLCRSGSLKFAGKSLTKFNDEGVSFDQIAQVIADHWKEL
jgi:hypothetical protein